MFGYDFVSLNDTQIATRREQLDQAGWQAFAAPIVLLIVVGTYRLLNATQATSATATAVKPSVPQKIWRRSLWTLNNSYINEFGPLHVQLLGVAYTALLLRRVFYQTGNDYMHVTKAFGQVAVSQLPMHYLLSIKSPLSPVTYATGLTHERLNAYHRLFGRILHSLLAVHAILYMRFFIAINVLQKRIQDWDVILGLAAFWSLNILAILSIPPIRRYVYYKVFYRSHVSLSLILPVIIWFHNPHTQIYAAMAGVLWFGNVLLRQNQSQVATVQCQNVSKDVVLVTAKLAGSQGYRYLPGVHIYLVWPSIPLKTPFTVAGVRDLASNETEIDFVAKVSGGPMTMSFFKAATVEREIGLNLEGPYGEAKQYMPVLMEQAKSTQTKFLLVAGGVGATYVLPVFQALQTARGSTKNIRVIWVVSNESDMAWAGSYLAVDRDLSPHARAIIVHITQPSTKTATPQIMNEVLKNGSHRPDFDRYVDDFVNERLKPSTRKEDGRLWEKDSTKSSQQLHEPVTVMVCGPSGLTKSVRTAVGKHVHSYGRDVRWYEEQYGFGGS